MRRTAVHALGPDNTSNSALSLGVMRADIAALAGVPTSAVSDDGNLIELGLDSLGVMRLANQWRARGANIKFAELIEHQSLAEWWNLVCSRMEHGGKEASTETPCPAAHETTAFDLAPMQLAYWAGRGSAQPLSSCSHYYFEFDSPGIDPVRLERAIKRATQRHEMLRARFLEDGRQEILPESPWPGLAVNDFRSLSPEIADARLAEIRERETHRKLSAEQGEVFAVQLSLCQDGRARLHLNIDMLICDALSFRMLMDELAQLYTHPSLELPPISYSYRRYLADKKSSNRQAYAQAQEYWRARLHTLKGGPSLPMALPRTEGSALRMGRRQNWLSAEQHRRLAERSREHGLTLPMALMTAFAEVLAAWSTEPRFVLNVPFFDREPLHPEVSRLVGDFSSSVLLDVDTSDNVGFLERARRLQTSFRKDAAQSAYPGVDVLRDLSRSFTEAASTAARVVFTSTLGMGELFSQRVRDTFGSPAAMISQTAQVVLDQQVTEVEGGLLINWDAIDSHFPDGVLPDMFAAYLTVVRWLASSESDWSGELPDLVPSATRKVRSAINSMTREQSGKLLHQAFFEQAEKRPERIALAWDDASQMTYGELARWARQISASLLEEGMAAGDRVAISLPKGPGQIAAVLGVLYSGGTYVPVGVDQPPKRRARMLASAGAGFILAEDKRAQESGAASAQSAKILSLKECDSRPPNPAPVTVSPESLAYIIFTSGSTGEPKGVMVPHRAAMNTIEDVLHRFPMNENDRVLAVSSLDFDWSVADIFELLSVGGAVVLVNEQERRDAVRWCHLVRGWRITIWQSVPALLDMLLTAASQNDLGNSLRLVMLGGDWVGLDQLQRLQKIVPGCLLVAFGGITETSIHCTIQEVTSISADWDSIPYGVPLNNVSCRVVDSRSRDCPDWVAGELWVGGAGVSNGYCGDAELTSQRFVQLNGERWYRSGDRARYKSTGILEFLGRADSQVKIRGHRIELGEVQAAIDEYPLVSQSLVISISDPSPHLAAVVVPLNPEFKVEGLREFLSWRLPAVMLPERISALQHLPLTKNGKVDRAEIRRLLSRPAVTDSFEAPRGEMEHFVAGLWAELLQCDAVGRNESFFGLGGDSLVATRLGARLREAGVEGFRLHRLFETPKLKDFVAILRPGRALPCSPIKTSDAGSRYDPFPLTEIQRAYWMGRSSEFTLGGVGSCWYWEFDGSGVDLARLEEAVNQLLLRHDMLRAVIHKDGTQQVLPSVRRFCIGCTEAPAGTEEAALAALRESLSRRVVDPSQWPLFDIRALRYGDGRTRIGFAFDYIVLDALSIVVFFSELGALYTDPATPLPAIALSFRDYVLNSAPDPNGLSKARSFWLEQIAELPPAPQLPLQTSPEMVRQPRFVRRGFRISEQEWSAIKAAAKRENLTPAVVVATAFAEVLSAWSAQPDLTLNFTLFDRRQIDPDMRIIGDFTSLVLVPYYPDPGHFFDTAARNLQARVWLSLEHKEFSALSVMRELAHQQGRPHALMPVVFTSTLGVAHHLANLNMPFGDYVAGLGQTPQVWLDCQVIESDGALVVNWDAVDELFPQHLLDAMLSSYQNLLNWAGQPEGDWHTEIPDLVPPGQRIVRQIVNATATPLAERTLHESFFRHSIESPTRAALVWDDNSRVTYHELANQALRIAAFLQQQGVRPDDLVGVTLPKGPGQVAAVLGVLAAGATYVPAGIHQPELRRRNLYANAGVRTVLQDLTPALEAAPLDRPVMGSPHSLAYVIHTSGSTGQPKGVQITHRAALNTIEDINSRFGVCATDSVLAISELDFDLSVYDMFGLLSAGGSVVMVDDEYRRDPRAWWRLLQRWNVTIWNSVPALLDMFFMAGPGCSLASLRLAMVSGDWVRVGLQQSLRERAPCCRFIALGGATEAAIWSNLFEGEAIAEGWHFIPYGVPLRNQEFRVVDSSGRDCPDWVPGELWIGGAGVATGYLADDSLTAKKFVYHDGRRWYRTGDLGRYRPGGLLEFLGRTDHQIKLGGHRIELGEIEAALILHPDVSRAVACVVGESSSIIAAGVAPREGRSCPAYSDLRSFLEDRLPPYMVPERIAEIPVLPLGANGKLDRKAVAAMLSSVPASPGDETLCGPIEIALATLWSDILSRPAGAEMSFFALGGDSLLAMQMMEKVRRRFGVELSLRQLFSGPTVRDLAKLIAQQRPDYAEGMEEGVA